MMDQGENAEGEDLLPKRDHALQSKDTLQQDNIPFNPRFSLVRTPPRTRGERSTKKRKQNDRTPTVSPRSREPTETYMGVIDREVGVIIESISMEKGGKITFNKGEQIKVRESLMNIQQAVSNLVYKLGVLEGRISGSGTSGVVLTEEYEDRDEMLKKLEILKTLKKQEKMIEGIKGMIERGRMVLEEERRGETMQERRREGESEVITEIGETTELETEEEGMIRGEQRKGRQRETDTAISGIEGDEEETEGPGEKVGRKKRDRKKTYAGVLTGEERRESRTGSKKDTVWKTPPPINRNKIEVKMEGKKTRREVMDIMKKKLNLKELGPIKSLFTLPNGNFVVNCRDRTQKETVAKKLEEEKSMTIRRERNVTPTFMITGIEEGLTKEQVLEELITMNPEVFRETGDETTVVGKRKCRNPEKENWIVQTSPENFKKIMKKGAVKFELLMRRVEECIRPAICYKCCKFGHVSKYCEAETPICYKCAGEHEGTRCENEELICVNCKKAGRDKIKHSARSLNCPIMEKKILWERRLISFDRGEEASQTEDVHV